MKAVTKLLVLACLLAIAPPASAQQDRIAGTIDSSRAVVLHTTVQPLALAQKGDEGPVEPSLKLPWITMMFQRTPAQQAALTKLLAQQQDRSSPNYHKWLSSQEYANQFGLSPNDYAKIAAWLESQGFKVEYRANDRDFIAFSGTAAQVKTTFQTEIHRYTIGGEPHYMNTTSPSIPQALSGIVLSIQGLNDLRLKPALAHGKHVSSRPRENNSDGSHSLAPDDLAAIYDIAPLYSNNIDGTGQKIVIVGQTNINLSDLETFRQYYNLPGADPQVIECCTPDPGDIGGDNEVESNLDLDVVESVAREATVLFVYSTGADASALYAIDQNLAPVITESFGDCEQTASSTGRDPNTFESEAQTGNAKGITWLAATGDSGAADCDPQGNASASNGLAVNFPASIPEVTAVGGTTFNEGSGTYWGSEGSNHGSALGYIPEMTWNDAIANGTLSSSGGGVSTFYPKPSWQTALTPDDGWRDLPDVALTASADHDGYNIYEAGNWQVSGGTSAATPLFASIVVLLNQYLANSSQGTAGNINPTLYSLYVSMPSAFHDVTTGNNMVPCDSGSPSCTNGFVGYSASPGYDLTTGLGSVDAYKLITSWGGSTQKSTTTNVTANPAAILTSGSTRVTATVASVSGGGTPTGNVSFSVGGNVLGTQTLSGGTAAITVYATQLNTGGNTISGTYSGDSTFSGSSGSAQVTVNTQTANSVVVPSVSPDPVYEQQPDANGNRWFFTVLLTETAGVATTLTDFTFDGDSYATYIPQWFGSANIPAYGTLSAQLAANVATVPTTVTFGFTGQDVGSGHTWTQQTQVPFYGMQISASVLMTAVPNIVRENLTPTNCSFSPPSPEWFGNLGLQEENGHSVTLTKFLAGPYDLSDQIATFFGSTTLPAYGSLLAGVCWPPTPPASAVYEIDGTDDLGNAISTTTTVQFEGPPTGGFTTLSVGTNPVNLSVTSASQTASTTLGVDVGTRTEPWTISVFPSNQTTSWLHVYPLSGTGPGTVTISAMDPSLTGTDTATLAVQAVDALPQFINVPVNFALNSGGGGGTAAQGMIIPQIADGEGWKTTFVLINTNQTSAMATIRAHLDTSGGNTELWNLPLVEGISTTNMEIPAGGTLFLHTPGSSAALSQGWAELIADNGVQGYTIFTLLPGLDHQSGTAPAVAPAGALLMPYDDTSFVSAIAVVNTSAAAETIQTTVLTSNGQTFSGSLSNIPSLGQAAFALSGTIPGTTGTKGTLELFTPDGSTFSVIGLRFDGGAFTALPVFPVGATPFAKPKGGSTPSIAPARRH
jgi:hypothetical protein